MHTGQKPFACEYTGCDAKFRQAGKLTLHRKEHKQPIFKVDRPRSRSSEDRLQANDQEKSDEDKFSRSEFTQI